MRLLLDTHTFLWLIAGDPNLSPSARQAVENPQNEPILSVASLWEMAIKVSLGKLTCCAELWLKSRPEVEARFCRAVGNYISYSYR